MEDVRRKTAKAEEKARTNLSLALCEKILLKLEVKPLLRFKCVCHGWHELISSSGFIHRHLELSTADPEQSHHRVFSIFPLTTIDYSFFGFYVEREWNKIIDKPLRYPRKMSRVYLKIMGSCDGLICLFSGTKKKIIIIWNPLSHELVTLPLPFVRDCVGFYWFGHDSDSNSYKLVLSSHRNKYYSMFEFKSEDGLYNWRKCKDEIVCLLQVFEKRGTFFNGKVHWPCLQNRRVVVSYDLSKSKIRRMMAPNGGDAFFTLGVFDECLSAICKPGENFEIWVMKEYGLEQSWTRLMELEGFETNSHYLRPLGTLRNGDLIVDVDGRTLERYYFNYKTTRVVKTHRINGNLSSDAISFVESLISPIHAIKFYRELLYKIAN